MTNTVFMDTVGLIATWDQADQWHTEASTAQVRLREESAYLISTSFIMLECGNSAARKPYRQAVDRLRVKLEHTGQLISPTASDWSTAWASYCRGEAGDAGIVDHVSFAVMRRLGITRVFTNDRHFQAAGFETLF